MFSFTVVNQQVSSIDILPTLLDVLDIPNEEIFEGTSLMRLVKGKRKKLYAVSEMGSYGKSIRTEAWKYCRIRSSELLFDLINDPGEHTNVTRDHLDTKDHLKTVLESFMAKRRTSLPENKAKLDKETLEQLRDLGYIR